MRLIWLCACLVSCGSSSKSETPESTGGATSTTGGSTSTTGGSTSSTGGAQPATGGATGGSAPTGGSRATGGSTPTGGSAPTGGVASDTGGAPPAATGGSAAIDLDPEPGDYGTRKALPAANSEMAVAELDGKIYLIGGYPSSPAETQSVVAVYEIATDDWSFAAELPIGLHHPVAVGVAGKIYSLGGQLASGETDRTLEYDPEADSWRDLQPMPTARGGGAAAVIGDKIYVAGGRPPAGNAFEVYDIGDDAWESLPDLPQTFPERNHLIAAALGDKIYVAGGRYDGGGFNSPRTQSLDVFDPSTGEWSLAAEMLRERGGLNGVAANGCFFVWGGEGSNIGEPNDVYPDHDVYDPITDTWTALPDLPTPVHGVTGSAFVDGLIYIPGGGTRSGGGSGTTLFQVYRVERTCL